MTKANAMSVIRTIRKVASCALLGAVTAGTAFGWIDHDTIDPRAVGASMGAVAGIGAAILHII